MAIEHFEKKKSLDSSLEDFIFTIVDFDSDLKKILSFCAVQVYSVGDKSFEIIKFDAAHGCCHVHRYYRQKQDPGEPLLNKEVSPETFEECRRDIMNNWRKYKKWYFEKRLF